MEKPLSYPNQQISIHVPSWGTTRSLFDLPFPLPISIHVPSWGTTTGSMDRSLCLFYFNPRSLVGNDGQVDSWQQFSDISIHVPSWGTTGNTANPASVTEFQSTFPRGERQWNRRSYRKYFHFNPRSLVGNDWDDLDGPRPTVISIHVPSWGTTMAILYLSESF